MSGLARRWIGPMSLALVAIPLTVAHPGVVVAAVATPTVTSVTPVTGSTAGGSRITVRGARFTRVQRVLFGSSVGRSVTVRSSGVLEVTAPAHAAGRVDLRVVTSAGTSPVVTADRYTYVAPPAVTRLSATSGALTGGGRITITGSRLAGVTRVLFGATAGRSVTVLSSTSVSVTVPGHVAGAVDVRVVNSYGTSPAVAAGRYTYIGAPTVTGLSPTSGGTAGGTRVTVRGTNFRGTPRVLFGTVPGISPTLTSTSALTVTAPPHAVGPADVRVSTAYGTSPVTSADRFTYVAAPTLTGMSPAAGSTAGGVRVTIRGSGLAATSQVTFGGAPGTALATAADSVAVTTPAHDPGPVTVQVVTPYGIASGQYTYVAPGLPRPTVSAVSPTSGSSAGGTLVTVTGTGFADGTTVSFGGTPGTSVNVESSTRLTVVAPTHPAGRADVTVTSTGGTSSTVPFSYADPACEPAVRHVSGPVSGAWSTQCVTEYVIDGTATIPDGAALTVAPGTVVRGGDLRVAGTMSVEGATLTGVDLMVLDGARLALDRSTLSDGWIGTDGTAALIRLTGSSFPGPGSISVGPCTDGEVAGNHFAGAAVHLTRCLAPVRGNHFDHTPGPLSLSEIDDLAAVGFLDNTFTGTGEQLRIDITLGRVRPGTTITAGPGVVLHPSRVKVEGTVLLLPGAIAKSDAGIQDRQGAFSVSTGGLVKLSGTAASPVTVTAYRDDSAGGDTNGDGSATDPTLGTWASGFATLNGGSLQADHVDMRWLVFPIIFEYEPAAELTIHNSRFSTPAPINADGLHIDTGGIGGNGCTSGEISGNTFNGTYLGMNGCAIPIHDNTFANTHHPMSLGHDNLAQVAFAGPTANTFTGTGDQLRVDLNGGRVRPGTTVTVDAAAGAVLHPNHLNVQGTLLLNPGVIVKSDAGIQNRGGAVTVPAGGKVTLFGTGAAAVTVTAYNDDSAGGDTNGDGAGSDPTTGTWASGFATLNGGSLDAQYAEFRWLVYPIISEYEAAGAVTVRGSTFRTPATINASGIRIETAAVSLGGCGAGEFSSNTFQGTSLVLTKCSIPVYSNKFIRTANPLTMAGDDIAKLDLAGDYTNTFTGTGVQRRVDLSAAHIAEDTTLAVDGIDSHAVLDLAAPITSSHAVGVHTGSVLLTGGAVVKGRGPLFDLGPESSFTVAGSVTAPVVFAPVDDDGVAGDTKGDGATGVRNDLSEIFKSNQSARWATVPLGAVGVDLAQTGPGRATISHAVVRHADTAFTGCLVCDLTVNDTDFIDVEVGVSQAFYQMPLAPCLPLMGRALLDGGNPVWQRADARNNYWGGAGGPTSDINWVEVATTFAGQKQQYDQLVAGLPLDQAGPVRSAFESMAAQWGDKIPNLDLADHAAATASLQSCTVPVINVTFPVLVIPEDFSDWSNTPVNDQSVLPNL